MARKIRFLGDLQRLDVKPGDTFVLSVGGTISADMAEGLKKMWAAKMGEHVPLLILADGMRLGVVSAAKG